MKGASFAVALCLAVTSLAGAEDGATTTPGVVVIRSSDSEPKSGDLRVGDRIVGWYSPDAAHDIVDPIDWLRFVIERAPRGLHSLHVLRAGQTHTIEIGGWLENLAVGPVLGGSEGALWRRAVAERDAGQGEAAAALFGQLAERLASRLAAPYLPRLEAWVQLEAVRARPRNRGEIPDIESVRQAIDRLAAADRARMRIRLAAAIDRHGDLRAALTLLEDALEGLELAPRDTPLTIAVCRSRIGHLLRLLGEPKRAEAFLEQALATQRRMAPGGLDIARTWNELGAVALARGALESAEDGFRRAFEIRSRLSPEGAETALSLNNLGMVADSAGRLDEAETLYRDALARQEAREPDSVDAASTLGNIAVVAAKRGDLESAERLFVRSLSIKERHQAGPAELADLFNNIGIVSLMRGDFASAETYYRRALAALQGLGQEGLETALLLSNLGWVIGLRGDLETGELLLLRSLARTEKLTPGGLPMAHALDLLGQIALIRRNPEGAETYFARADAIFEAHAPESLLRARSLRNLGRVALARDEFESARTFVARSNELIQAATPDGLDLAIGHWFLGKIAYQADDLERAKRGARHALALGQEIAPQTMIAATSHRLLGDIAARAGRGSDAEEHYQASLRIAARWGLEEVEAASHLGLARVHRAADRRQQAARAYKQAMALQEGRRRLLGGGDLALARYGDAIVDIAHEYIDLLITLGQPRQAFDTLERYRARSLRDLLAGRELVHRDLPPALDGERRRLDTAYDRLLEEIASWSGTPESEATLRAQLADLRSARGEVRARIRATAPRLAALRQAEALDLTSVRAQLGPDTLMLAYAFGQERVHLFAVSGDRTPPLQAADSLRAVTLEIGAEALRRLVTTFRQAIELTRSGAPGPITDADVERLGRRLYDLLIAPVGDLVESAGRLLIVGDGALHNLPFAALVSDRRSNLRVGEPAKAHYLVEWKPLVSTLSASVLADLRTGPPPADDPAAGEPTYDLVGVADPRLVPLPNNDDSGRDATRFTDSMAELPKLEALPGSRQELLSLARAYAPDRVRLLLGAEATEARLRQAAARARVVHFATHGLIDARSPLDSALVLSTPGQVTAEGGNGLLQVWEIFEGLPLTAQLVVLSACDSGLGEELSGEGLYGLVRAFHYAGAPSVVASLWSVADTSTGALMARFHAGVAGGLSIDEALRQAQIALIRGQAGEQTGEQAVRPYHWAGFQLYGAWRALDGLSTAKP